MVGIYMIENKVNGKRYIGQTWDTELRWYQHTKQETNRHLKSAYQKYGIDNFEYRVLYELKEEEQNQDRLDELEIAYIDILDTINSAKGYNMRTGGMGGKHSKETILKMSEIKKGKKASRETKEKSSASHKGQTPWNKGKKGNLAWNKGVGSKVRCIETGVIYGCANDVKTISGTYIRRVCKGKQITAGNLHWEYVY